VGVKCATVALKKKSRKNLVATSDHIACNMMKEIRNIQKITPANIKHRDLLSNITTWKKSWRNMMKEIRNIRSIQKITPATIEIYLCNITT
jgi:hypothetical protein